MRRYRGLPSLQYLLGFEAAARLGSFSAAAAELGLTQSAISHQMKMLESRFGQPLFLRIGRQVRLTDAGRDYQRSVAASLDTLDKGQKRLSAYANPQSVVIYAPRGFAARWLMPRLGPLLVDCPSVEPWIDTTDRIVDFEETEASIVFRQVEEPQALPLSLTVGREDLTPLATPAMAERFLGGEAPVLFESEASAGWSDFLQRWPGTARGRIVTFSDLDVTMIAAEDGLGVALASPLYQSTRFPSGALVAPMPQRVIPGRTWVALTTEAELDHPATRSVWDWLAAEIGRAGNATP